MTWHTFLSLDTLESRHLLAAYGIIFLLQGGYFAWMVHSWRASRSRRP